MHAAETPVEPVPPVPPVPFAMDGIKAIGLGDTFDDLHLSLSGWVEQSYTYNFASPHDRTNALRTFDDRSNDYRFNQLGLVLKRDLSDGNGFDIGGEVELLYGSDGRFIHSAGLADHQTDTIQFDPVQFYGLVRVPVGNGLTVKFGKFDTTIGAEVIEAPGNALYSHSYLFGFAIPFTHTGIMLSYPINDNLSVYYGLVQGWDVFNDTNASLSHMFGGSWSDDRLTIAINTITGPERADENTDYRTVLDLVTTYHWNDAFSTTLNMDFGNESGVSDTSGGSGGGNNWYGVAGYGTYTFNPQLAGTLRAEWFRDETGSRLGFTGDVYEVTAGLDIHPIKSLQNLRIRPEIRWDHAPADTPFNGGTRHDQVTIGADVIFTF